MTFYYLTLGIEGRRKSKEKKKQVTTKVASSLSARYRCPGKAAVVSDPIRQFSRQQLHQVFTYCHLGKILWETTELPEVLTEWPVGGGPGAAVLAATKRQRGGGSQTPGLSPGLVLG